MVFVVGFIIIVIIIILAFSSELWNAVVVVCTVRIQRDCDISPGECRHFPEFA